MKSDLDNLKANRNRLIRERSVILKKIANISFAIKELERKEPNYRKEGK